MQISWEMKQKFLLFLGILKGISIPILIFWGWLYMHQYSNIISELRLFASGIHVNGTLTRIEEFSDIVEEYDGRKVSEQFIYSYEYQFIASNNRLISGSGKKLGKMPSSISLILNVPNKLRIQYLQNNPSINRVIDFEPDISFWAYVRDKFLFIIIIEIFVLFFIYRHIQNSYENYKKKKLLIIKSNDY